MLRNYMLLATAFSLAAPMYAQIATRRASITGGTGDVGKCTIEVRVDQAAEVEVSGDTGRIRTFSGQPASWDRFDCTSPIPRNPSDFRFRGIDGRGNVQLVNDPRSGRGVAVVRIEDPKGGAERYTFDLEWRGGSDYNSGGYNRGNSAYGRDDRYHPDDRYAQDGRYSSRNDYGRSRNNVVACSGNGNRRTYCEADTSGGVRLLRESGNSSCQLGSTWGFDRRGIWVERGCRGEFQVGR